MQESLSECDVNDAFFAPQSLGERPAKENRLAVVAPARRYRRPPNPAASPRFQTGESCQENLVFKAPVNVALGGLNLH